MDTLYREWYRRRNGADPAVLPGWFSRLSSHQSPGIQAHLTWKGQRLVGTSINVATPEILEGTFGAFAEEYHGGPAYYNDLCYEPIRMACAQGIPALDLGPPPSTPRC